jgi:hypothetical protein
VKFAVVKNAALAPVCRASSIPASQLSNFLYFSSRSISHGKQSRAQSN